MDLSNESSTPNTALHWPRGDESLPRGGRCERLLMDVVLEGGSQARRSLLAESSRHFCRLVRMSEPSRRARRLVAAPISDR